MNTQQITGVRYHSGSTTHRCVPNAPAMALQTAMTAWDMRLFGLESGSSLGDLLSLPNGVPSEDTGCIRLH